MATSTPLQRDAQTGRCPRCLQTDIDHTPRETYCRACGYVLEDTPIDHGPDWRDFGEGEQNERAAPGNRNLHDRGLGSEITWTSEDGMADRRRTINRHAKTNKRDRNRAYATGQIHRMTAALELPRFVGDRAKHLFRRAHETDLAGQDLDTVAAACLLAACRESQLGRTAGDLEAVARSDETAIQRRLLHLQRDLALELPPPDVRQRVRVVAGRLDGGTAARQQALELVADVDTANTSPSTVAASVLYVAGDWTQAEVCAAAGVTPAGERACRARLGIAE